MAPLHRLYNTKSIRSQNPNNCQDVPIRMVPELNIAALATRQDKELLFWYLLRTINVTGCGHVLLLNAEREFTTKFKYSRRTFYRHLRLGKGKLWGFYDTGHAVIKIYALKTVCEWFHTYKLSKWVEISLSQYTKYPRKALIWNTGAYRPFGTGRANHPVARQSLQNVTTIPRLRQWRYDKQVDTLKERVLVKNRDPRTHKVHSQLMPVPIKGQAKIVFIKRQLGNQYYSHATQSRCGMVKRASRQASRKSESLIRAEAPHRALIPAKRFFNTFSDCVKYATKGKALLSDTFYPLKSNKLVYVQCY